MGIGGWAYGSSRAVYAPTLPYAHTQLPNGAFQLDSEQLLGLHGKLHRQLLEDFLAEAVYDELEGLFLAFQYPVELPGVSMTNFLKESVNSVREARGQEELSSADFLQYMRERAEMVNLDADLTKRSVNEGFSGGEKKRNEIFQLAMLEPRLAILDETDSGLDIDALKSVADGVNKLRDDDRGFLVITHYERILQYITPDRVHVMLDGRVVRSGDKELATKLEEKGYEWIREEELAAA